MLGFDVPTFVFQIINFLILLAILTRFLYRPVLAVMKRRQEQIDARIADAEERGHEADEERQKLASQSVTAARDAALLIDSARNEAVKERQRLLLEARMEAASLIDEARRTAAAEQEAALNHLDGRLSQSAVAIAGALIRGASGEAVHKGLVERLVADGFGLDEADLIQAKLDYQTDSRQLVVESAYAFDAKQEEALRQQAARTLGLPSAEIRIEVREDPELIAGVRVLIGAIVADMSLKHMLEELSRQEGGR